MGTDAEGATGAGDPGAGVLMGAEVEKAEGT